MPIIGLGAEDTILPCPDRFSCIPECFMSFFFFRAFVPQRYWGLSISEDQQQGRKEYDIITYVPASSRPMIATLQVLRAPFTPLRIPCYQQTSEAS